MRYNICPICAAVSSTWLLMSAGVAWGYLTATAFLIPISLLMGGTVVGIAYLGEKRFNWAVQHPQKWKSVVTVIGMTIAYLLVTNLAKFVVGIELIIIITLAYLFFIKKPTKPNVGVKDTEVGRIEKQMEQCC